MEKTTVEAIFSSSTNPFPLKNASSTPAPSAIVKDQNRADPAKSPIHLPPPILLDHESSAHYFRVMKNITFSADEHAIRLAREEARARNTTLNSLFREWIDDLAARDERRKSISDLLGRMGGFDSGGPFTRDEMNER